jgi:hypothetical protein
MPLITLSVQHGHTCDEARSHLETAVQEITSHFGTVVRRVEWSTDRSQVQLEGRAPGKHRKDPHGVVLEEVQKPGGLKQCQQKEGGDNDTHAWGHEVFVILSLSPTLPLRIRSVFWRKGRVLQVGPERVKRLLL